MYLKQIIIINYKSCSNIQLNLSKDDPNILIGINDCGKSTILSAIGLLLEDKPTFNYVKDDKKKNDISNTRISSEDLSRILESNGLPLFKGYEKKEDDSYSNKCLIFGEFQFEENDISEELSDKLSPHLQWIFENYQDNNIWFCREFDGDEMKHFDYLLTPDYIERPLRLFYEKSPALGKIKDEFNVTSDDIVNENRKGRFKNTELIRAIYSKVLLEPGWSQYEKKNDRLFFPEYRYLDWNISMNQLNEVTKDIIDTKINTEVEKAKVFASGRAIEAQKIVNDELKTFTDEFAADLENIKGFTANINFQVTSIVTDLFVQKTNSDGSVHLDNQGEGIKRQIWFALLKWRAMNSIQEGHQNKKFIWCFDEPETHLYPKAQREFFEIIKKVSRTNVQSILSTHSTVFIDRAKFSNINKIDIKDGYSIYSTCKSIDDIYDSLQLKNSDFLFYDKFLVIEGDTEQVIIPHMYKIHKGTTLKDDSIQLVNLGGKDKVDQNKVILEEVLNNFRKTDDKVTYLFDSDAKFSFTQSQIERSDFNFVGKQDIEDSIPSSVWKSIIDEKFGDRIAITADDIDAIKESIPADTLVRQSNQKFYPKLVRLLREKLIASSNNQDEYNYDILPSKGTESGKLLARHITAQSQIPSKIIEVFDKLT